MTVMADALRSAGIVPADEQLEQIATDAWVNNPGPKQHDAAIQHVSYAIRNDARLLWALFEPHQQLLIGKLLDRVKAKLHAAEKARVATESGGRARRDDQGLVAPSEQRASGVSTTSAHTPAASSPSGGQSLSDDRASAAASERGATHAATTSATVPLARPAAGDSGRLSNAISVLDNIMIDIAGRDGVRISTPIGKCTPRQANSWADKRVLDTRFIRMITANVPPDDLIGKWVSGDEANSIWQRAIEAHRNAA